MKPELGSQFYHMDRPTKTCDSYTVVCQVIKVYKCDNNTKLDQNKEM